MNVIQEINNVNDKFATQGSKLRIEKRGEKLNIRGSLPSKEDKNNFKVQRISLGIKADISGLEEAKKKLQLINLQLELNQFDWINWISKSNKKEIKNDFEFPNRLNQFEESFFKERKNEYLSSTRKTTWRSSYKPYLKRILNIYNHDENEDLENIFQKTLESYKEGSRSRKQCATSLSVLAKFLDIKLPVNWKLNSKGYGLNKAGFRDLPTDEVIEKLWEQIPNKSWKFVFGLMATYGLRNHEVFFCDLNSLTNFGDKIIRVLPTTKTGEHQVWPFHPEWVEKFELSKLGENPQLLPNINRDLKITTLQNIGKKITDQFKRYSLKIKPYDLRHAWAVRTIFYDLPDTVAARMMGHSVSLHTQTYHHWITKRDQQQAVNNAILKVNRAKIN
ncbi:site-specific integrase [Prochlorococcus marinus]|uniref:site-specific integrase n=1 Tax=Prochlorococcus marinus TaxID=1219 RepID=UPI001ADBF6F4|nr:site-specific integrase [Prochlorococcus marinus]MBO8218720.1 site-specific integrase [Prochlorococcus marinus CUG1416]MBW3051124.1 integrase [Prochlorococcus marinus str. MU1416]